MATTMTPKTAKNLPGLCSQWLTESIQEAQVSIHGYFYMVDFGPAVQPSVHRVGKDKRCLCMLGKNCPSIQVVTHYLQQGGERAPDPPQGYYPVAPAMCPVCGSKAVFDKRLSSRHRGAGWRCSQGGSNHYWEAHGRRKRKPKEWVFPPVLVNGQIIYQGVKDLVPISTKPNWPDGYNPNL